ncbi:MAG: hypothetical protein IJF39_05090 [Clostridia bacterium]|nr:hypothetical protein [Clostridia bacterium]
MGNKTKKFISLLSAAVVAGSALAFSACSPSVYGLDEPLSLPATAAEVQSNGGFAVEKGGYVYFINGQEVSTADNVYGKVKKGSLMRISTQNLTDGNYDKAEVVVPLLFVSGNTDSGIYIQGDYVYFATPTTDKDLDGNVMSHKLDFKRAKLDGTEVMSDFYFRTETNNVQYRFVKGDDGKVYCMYVEDGTLKSYDVENRKTTVLVKGAASGFVFDKKNHDNDVVYYTMNVPDRFIGTDKASTEAYTQVYRVSATATVEVDEATASYTAKDGSKYSKTYDFDETYFKKKNDEAKEKDEEAKLPYDLSDYTTYGYVNLGELVLDGIGSSERPLVVPTETTMQFHSEEDYDAAKETTEFTELLGYTYTIQSYENGGIYFTRTVPGDSGLTINSLYYLADTAAEASGWNTILGNNGLTVVSNDTANASTSALFYLDENGKHNYLYVSGDKLMRAIQPSEGVEDLTLARNGFTSRKLLYTAGDYLYTYVEDAKNLYRINYTGSAADYKAILDKAEYKDEQILAIEFNTAWYKPEIFNGVLLYNNAQTINGNPYNYINAVSMAVEEDGAVRAMTTEELVARNEKYEEVMNYIEGDVAGDKNLSAALKVYFRTGSTEAVDAIWNEYGNDALSDNDKKEFDAFVGHKLSERKPVSATQTPNDYTEKFKDGDKYYDVESYYFGMLGDNYSDVDEENLAEDWKKSIYLAASNTSDGETEGLAWWAWLLIAVGGVAVVVGGVFLGIYLRKRSKAAMEERMRSSKPRKKIDTTDDKTIDVYADDAVEAPAEEAEAATEEVEETVEEAAEETAE